MNFNFTYVALVFVVLGTFIGLCAVVWRFMAMARRRAKQQHIEQQNLQIAIAAVEQRRRQAEMEYATGMWNEQQARYGFGLYEPGMTLPRYEPPEPKELPEESKETSDGAATDEKEDEVAIDIDEGSRVVNGEEPQMQQSIPSLTTVSEEEARDDYRAHGEEEANTKHNTGDGRSSFERGEPDSTPKHEPK
ncbi:hypothetical protein BJ742DRAFT_446099 [Cladochytrium replicatum]|nr:hypothetical protein BJ742DRAFT_446099 [Cladochytrium replicatum]